MYFVYSMHWYPESFSVGRASAMMESP